MRDIIHSLLNITILLSFSTVSFAAETIRISTLEGSPYISEHFEHYGFVSQIVTEAFATMNIKVEFGFFPAARAIHVAKHGSWDGSLMWVRSVEREKVFYYSEPLIEGPLVFFHLKSYQFNWEVIDDLKNINIGIVYGNYYGQAFDDALKENKLLIERVPTNEMNFRKLLRERIKLYPINREYGYALLQEKFHVDDLQKITHHPKPLKTSVYHLILSKAIKENKRRLELFNEGLKKIKANGKYEQIIKASQQ